MLIHDTPEIMDKLLEQMSIMKADEISELEFFERCYPPMTLDLMDESGKVKLGEMTCLNCYTDKKG